MSDIKITCHPNPLITQNTIYEFLFCYLKLRRKVLTSFGVHIYQIGEYTPKLNQGKCLKDRSGKLESNLIYLVS